ncbi:hypothetical protein C8R45DRAFT_950988 [Mycena sanguinolenta]|nr:hypothetical protein C8R45DRAFT_950988 [Mycena sanguinolenta]
MVLLVRCIFLVFSRPLSHASRSTYTLPQHICPPAIVLSTPRHCTTVVRSISTPYREPSPPKHTADDSSGPFCLMFNVGVCWILPIFLFLPTMFFRPYRTRSPFSKLFPSIQIHRLAPGPDFALHSDYVFYDTLLLALKDGQSFPWSQLTH